MATKAKKSRGKSMTNAGAKRGAKPRRGRTTAKSAKKTARGTAKRAPAAKKKVAAKKAARKTTVRKTTVRKTTVKKASSRSPLARVKRVAQEVAAQATTAVTAGVETLKGFGESIVERVETVTNPT